jgi:MtN3 and saliva related transmembrane protein
MFLLMTFGVALWMIYGLILGDWPLIIGNGLTLLLSGSILYCKLRYG